MCGIICYVGQQPALPLLLEGLKRLEYRGYDSSGVALLEDRRVQRFRAAGKIRELEKSLADWTSQAQTGIGHTRWATHGKPCVENAHPHSDCSGQIFLIHNGIIENYQALKQELTAAGHIFVSETDTEVLTHLIEDACRDAPKLEEAVARALVRVRGTFGIAVLSSQHPSSIIVARRSSPMIIGIGDSGMFAASDVSALVAHTKQVIYLQDDDLAVLGPDGYRINNLHSPLEVNRQEQTVDWDVAAAEKQGFRHFMLKEIHEQPEAVRNAMRGRLIPSEGISVLGGLESVSRQLIEMEQLVIVSCGTSFYAAMLGRYILEACTDIRVEVDLASEFRYRRLNFRPNTVVLAISQSGETADTLAAVREAKRKGALVLGLVNVVGSNIARETDAGIYNHAGPEIGVASTKAFVSQLTILYLFTLYLARHQHLSVTDGQRFIRELESIPRKIERILEKSGEIEEVAKTYAHFRNFMYIGRKFNYPIALEGALKLKEISYLHAEAYAAGEMKHGPIALISPDFPSVCLATQDSTYDKMTANIQEIKARSGPTIAVGTEGDAGLRALCDHFIAVPACSPLFAPLLTVIPLQLFAYYVALENGCEIDQPRNLAKSVTVE
ncbi:MAG: glutamine--fructose-6-phosphate transaminase (isomerizing) [Acidobacteriota bacterium]